MSIFSGLFGSKKKDKGPTTGEAIQKLRETEEMLHKKEEFLEKKIALELDNAKRNASSNKRAAILSLKRKKKYEKQLQQIDGTLSTIEMQREALESANTNTAVLKSMKDASDALKNAHQHMDVDEIHDMMDDIAETQDVAKEITNAISSNIGDLTDDLDEDELNRELEELEQQELDNKLIDHRPEPLPDDVVSKGVKAREPARAVAATTATKAKDVDDELKELEAWAT